jgi:hypothetical protein
MLGRLNIQPPACWMRFQLGGIKTGVRNGLKTLSAGRPI